MNAPTESQRRTVLSHVLAVVDRKFMGAHVDTAALRERHEQEIARAATKAEFEDAMNRMLRDMGASHVGFFHEATPRAAGRYRDCSDVHEGRHVGRPSLGLPGCASGRSRRGRRHSAR